LLAFTKSLCLSIYAGFAIFAGVFYVKLIVLVMVVIGLVESNFRLQESFWAFNFNFISFRGRKTCHFILRDIILRIVVYLPKMELLRTA